MVAPALVRVGLIQVLLVMARGAVLVAVVAVHVMVAVAEEGIRVADLAAVAAQHMYLAHQLQHQWFRVVLLQK